MPGFFTSSESQGSETVLNLLFGPISNRSPTYLHGIHGRYFGYYRMIASTFPYGIYYREKSSKTEVVAILGLRRNPSWLRRQLRKR